MGHANLAFTASAAGALNGDSFTFTESTTAARCDLAGRHLSDRSGRNRCQLRQLHRGLLNGTPTVGQATLTVTAGNASRAYGAANPAFTASAAGALNGDTFQLHREQFTAGQ